MRTLAATLLVAASFAAGCNNDDNDNDARPADDPAPATQAPSSGSNVAPDEQGGAQDDPAD